MKKLYAILFLCIFSYQTLPFEDVGKLLGSGIMSEETQHTTAGKKNFTDDKHTCLYACMALHEKEADISVSFLFYNENILQHPHLDVLLQPPNC